MTETSIEDYNGESSRIVACIVRLLNPHKGEGYVISRHGAKMEYPVWQNIQTVIRIQQASTIRTSGDDLMNA